MKAIFLDRDGVINREPGSNRYVTRLKDFKFLPRAKKAIAKLTRSGFAVFVVSNQAGVGKGIFSQKSLDEITSYMLGSVRNSGGEIKKVCYCTHKPESNCLCRKPKAGMFTRLKKEYPFSIKKAFFVGDTIRDIKTAKAAGCKSILVLTGKETLNNAKKWQPRPDLVFKDLMQAAEFIIAKEKK